MNIALARLDWLLFVVEFFPGTLLAQAKTQIEDNSYLNLNLDRNQIACRLPCPCSEIYALRTTTYAGKP